MLRVCHIISTKSAVPFASTIRLLDEWVGCVQESKWPSTTVPFYASDTNFYNHEQFVLIYTVYK